MKKEDKAKLKKYLEDIKALQEKYRGKAMPEADAKSFEDMCGEAKTLQDEADRDTLIATMEGKASRIPDPAMPELETPEQKAAREALEAKANKGKIIRVAPAGYMRLGHYVVASKGFRDFAAARYPRGQYTLAEIKDLHGRLRTTREGENFIGVTSDEIEQMKAVTDAAAPLLSEWVVTPDLIPELVRAPGYEHLPLRMRDVLNISQTTSNAVKYIRLVKYTRSALAVAPGTPKPFSAMQMDTKTTAVRTIAVWLPVDDQQLEDIPALAALINGELLYDIDRHLEELVVWGNGEGEEFEGILHDPDVAACRTKAGDTLVDVARRGITDVRLAGYEPNVILVNPMDWETIMLVKGTTQMYVWVVVTEGGVQRLWGVPVVETIATQDFGAGEGETPKRKMIVGDFARGATLWDRKQAAVSVGWINDQFVRNQRTILAEMRAAFGVLRPAAFRTHETEFGYGHS